VDRIPPGLFITGTDTGVGKTYVAALAARRLHAAGYRVGVYKPAASGCQRRGGVLVSDDAVQLWEAAGQPGELDLVCPQRFAAPLAPHLAARAEGRRVDPRLLREGLAYWRGRSDVVLVEGAGGLLSPLSDDDYVADLAAYAGYPLLIVARNSLGTINHTLQTLVAASSWRLRVGGIVLNAVSPAASDTSSATNRRELETRCVAPLLCEVVWQAEQFDPDVDWHMLASRARGPGIQVPAPVRGLPKRGADQADPRGL
jgi:dethiobiotin synthetase